MEWVPGFREEKQGRAADISERPPAVEVFFILFKQFNAVHGDAADLGITAGDLSAGGSITVKRRPVRVSHADKQCHAYRDIGRIPVQDRGKFGKPFAIRFFPPLVDLFHSGAGGHALPALQGAVFDDALCVAHDIGGPGIKIVVKPAKKSQ